jgi:hypothetical protein
VFLSFDLYRGERKLAEHGASGRHDSIDRPQ